MTETSVQANLRDLFSLEEERRDAHERARQEAEEALIRRTREVEAREHAYALARELERERVAGAQRERDEALDARISALRSQLDEVRAQREAMQLAITAGTRSPNPPSRGGWMAVTMASASLVAALGAVAFSWPTVEATAPVIAASPARPVVVETPAAPVVEAAPIATPDVAPAPATAAPRARTAPRVRSQNRRPHLRQRQDLADQLDLGDDESVLNDDFLRQAGN